VTSRPPSEVFVKSLVERINAHEVKVAVVGLGYVGMPLAVEMAGCGIQTVGIDVTERRVANTNAGISEIKDVPSERLHALVKSGTLLATTRFDVLAECDAVIVCVPTPLNKTREPDVSYTVEAGKQIAKYLRKGMLVVLESTTYPGFTREVYVPMFEETGLRAGVDFHLAFSPERIDPGNARYGVKNTTKIVGGLTPACSEAVAALYSQYIEHVHPVSSTDCAEMVKLLENTFRAVNIGLVNEIALICHKLGLDTWEVIEGAATKPFGYMPFFPGPGLGGHCIPIDPLYLSWKLRSMNYQARFIELADTINSKMPEHVMSVTQDALNDVGKAVKGSRVLVLGVAYKKDIDDWRESPAIDVIEQIRHKGAQVAWYDPHVRVLPVGDHHEQSAPSPFDATEGAHALEAYDVVVLTTDHTSFDIAQLVRRARLVVDTRNATRNIREGRDHIVRL